MKPRTSVAPQPQLGLIAWLENTRHALPLKGVECRFEVTGAVAGVELDQIYHQDAAQPLDCVYTFPLPAGAAVYRCELHVNGRVIRAKVEAKQDARRIYEKQKAAGRRAALVETERENLFTLSLGNVQPGDLVVVRFAWFQVLDRSGGALRLLVPTCPGVRYIPGQPLLRDASGRGTSGDTDQVPDASRISPPRIDALHSDAAYFSMAGRLFPGDVESGTLSSPSHALYVRENPESIAVGLSGRDAIPDRDLVLAWREPAARQLEPQAWHVRQGRETYALVQLRAPAAVEVAADYSQDVYFLVDRSGSMAGEKWRRTCEALRAFVALLGAEDRVWITLFESAFVDFSEAPMPAPRVLADRGFLGMEGLGVAGGTELLPAAEHVLQRIAEHSTERRAVVILITDGQIGNEQAVQKAFEQASTVTVHTFGIDTAVNDAFLKSLARRFRGGCWLQTPDDDIAGTIASLGDRLRRPVLTDLALGGKWEGSREPLPDLHAAEIATIALRGSGKTIKITGRLPDGHEHRCQLGLGAAGGEAIRLLWAKERIASHLQAGGKKEAIELARKHNLLCDGTSFVAWDEAEQVPIALQEIVQPAMEPQKRLRTLGGGGNLFASRRDVMCCSMPADAAPAAPPRAEVPCDPAALVEKHLMDARTWLEQAKVPRETIERMVGSISERDARAGERASALADAALLLTRFRGSECSPLLRVAVEQDLSGPLLGSADDLVGWVAAAQPTFFALAKLASTLRLVSGSEEVPDYLVMWILESGLIDAVRLKKAREFFTGLFGLPFSQDVIARHWESFLEESIDAEMRAAAPPWRHPVELASS